VRRQGAQKNCPMMRSVQSPKEIERGRSIQRVPYPKNSRRPSHLLLMDKSNKGKKQRHGYWA